MRKTKLFKRTAAITLSAAMVITSINVMPGIEKKASAKDASTPFVSFDFTNSNLAEKNGKGSVTEITEGSEATAEGLKLVNGHATLPSDLFNDYAGDGLTISMKYSKQNSDWPASEWSEPLFNFSAKTNAGEKPEWNESAELAKVASKSLYCSYNGNIGTGVNLYGGDGAWLDGSFGGNLGKDTWHTVTVTYDIATNTVTDYIDGIKQKSATSDKASLNADDIKNFTYNAIGYHTDGGWSMWSFCTVASMEIYDTALTGLQVFEKVKNVNGSKVVAAMDAASAVRTELYTDDTVTVFNEKYKAAQNELSSSSATQESLDAAADALTDAQTKLVRKSENLSSDLLVNTDITDKTSAIDKTSKIVTNDGFSLKAVGDSEIQDGYITGAKEVYTYNGKNGAILDGSVLKNTTAEKGFTINAKLSLDADTLDGDKVADWSDVIGFYDIEEKTDETTGETKTNETYKLRATLGLAMMSPKGTFSWPGDKGILSNGFAWNSYKTEAADNKVIDYTVTLDKNAYSIYINGKLAVTYANNDENWLDPAAVIDYTDSITFMMTKDSTPKKTKDEAGNEVDVVDADGNKVMARLDLLGKLYGVQVYGRALNAAEVDTLVGNGITAVPRAITFKNQAADATISIKDANGTEVATATCGSDGAAVVRGLTSDVAYTWSVKNGDTWTREGSITVNSDKVIDGYPLTSVKFAKDTVAVENSMIDNVFKAGVSNVPDLELTPATTTETKDLCKVTYVSDNESVVKVDANDGKLTGVADGSANITATVVSPSGNTFTATCKVTVSTKVVTSKATAVKLDKESETLEVGKTLQLKAEVTPAEALQQGKWTSSNPAAATVNDAGLVTAVAPGETTITFTTDDGTNLTATCKITVNQKNVAVTGITIDKQTVSIEIGKAATLSACVLPENASNKNITWKSENEKIATVKDGVVTGIAAGTVKVYAVSAADEKVVATCTVTVTEPKKDDTNKDDTNKDDTNKDDTNKDDTNKDDTNKDDTNNNNNNSSTKKPSLKKATITVKNGKKKVSSVTVKRKKTVKLSVSVNSKTKLSMTKLSKKSAKIAKVTFKKNKLTIKGLKKGKISIKLTSKKNSKYKAATKTVKVTVK